MKVGYSVSELKECKMEKDFVFNQIRALKKNIRKNESTILDSSYSSGTSRSRKLLHKLHDSNRTDLESAIQFYDYYNEFELNWHSVQQKTVLGKVNILSLDKVLINYKDFVYFDHTPEESPLRDFKIIDFFVDEACVGIYVGREDLLGMHFFEFENEAFPLHLDFEGYLNLLGVTRGYLYWQKVILDHLNNRETPITKEFKENMPKLFEDFDYKDFIKLYESLRIDQ